MYGLEQIKELNAAATRAPINREALEAIQKLLSPLERDTPTAADETLARALAALNVAEIALEQ